MLPWTAVYTARTVLAALQGSHRRRRDAAAVTPREPQSREARVLFAYIDAGGDTNGLGKSEQTGL